MKHLIYRLIGFCVLLFIWASLFKSFSAGIGIGLLLYGIHRLKH